MLLTILLLQISYAQTMPSRFVKNILDAADENGDGVITESEVRHLLERIGAGGKLSDEDIHGCMLEFGVTDGEVSVKRVRAACGGSRSRGEGR